MDDAPPRQLPEAASGALEQPSPSDSAPPPRSLAPVALPPKDYFAHSLQTPVIPQTLRPNSTIPAFLRFLSVAIFLGGTAAAAAAWIYTTILYPRLVLALAARTTLHISHEAAYERLLDGIRSLGKGKGYQLIAPHRPSVAESPAGDKAAPAAEREKAAPVSEKGELAPAPEQAAAPSIFSPLQSSLRILTTALASDPVSVLETTTFSSPATPLRPTQALQSSLSALSDYLAAETLASISSAYRTQVPSANGAGKDQKALQDAVTNLKAEIRQVKGALLNRRNFAALVPRAAPTAVQA